MEMNVRGVGMIDETAIKNIRTLVYPHIGLGMDTEVKAIEVIDPTAQALPHRIQEPAQGIRFVAAFNLCYPAIFDGQTNRLIEVRAYADVPRPPAEHAVKDENA